MSRDVWTLRLLRCVVLIFALGTWVHAHSRVPWVLWGGDETEYADVARRLGRGEGFTTGIIYPAELLRWGADRAHPSVVRPPLWPVQLGIAFALAGPHDAVVHATTLLAYLAVVWATMALATLLAGPWAGALAGLATATSPPLLHLAVLATPEPGFALWIVLTFFLLARGAPPVQVGLLCGLAYLTRYNGIVLLPIAALLLLWRDRQVVSALACATGFVLVAMPWWARNVLVADNPFYSLYNITPYLALDVTSYTKMLIHIARA
jgi:4-amino-4-deoxy-L-arabinose transferase-like glycosyltransferase